MIPLEPDRFYHLYNRAIGDETVFKNSGNYIFFLQKFGSHITPIADTFCFCLMPNHFHFLLRIKNESEIREYQARLNPLGKQKTVAQFCSKQFSNFFSSYTQAFNKQQNRMGSLFIKNFKRKLIDNEKYMYQLIHYIHYNPIEAGLVDKLYEWKFSSYAALISQKPTALKREELLRLYEDVDNFIHIQSLPPVLSRGDFH